MSKVSKEKHGMLRQLASESGLETAFNDLIGERYVMRDSMAKAAMTGVMVGQQISSAETIARKAYEIADAMMKARWQ